MEDIVAEELPKATVIVPMRNEEDNIERCLKALLTQDYPGEKLEILVVDGMSTDSSRDIVESIIKENEKRGLAQSREENSGLGERLTHSEKDAQGERDAQTGNDAQTESLLRKDVQPEKGVDTEKGEVKNDIHADGKISRLIHGDADEAWYTLLTAASQEAFGPECARPTVRLLSNPKQTVPCALNIGIENATGDIIMRVDAHCMVKDSYVSSCVIYLDRMKADNVGGPMRAVGRGYMGRAIAMSHHCRFGLGGGSFHRTNCEGHADTVYLGAWPRDVFKRVGLFDETLDRNQDIEFNARLRKHGGTVFLVPHIRSYYFCRQDLRSLWSQSFATGSWNLYTIMRQPGSLSCRHFVPLAFMSSLIVSAIAWLLHPAGMYLMLATGGSYVVANLAFSFRVALKGRMKYSPVMPLVFATLHFGYGLGTLVGIKKWLFSRKRPSDPIPAPVATPASH